MEPPLSIERDDAPGFTAERGLGLQGSGSVAGIRNNRASVLPSGMEVENPTPRIFLLSPASTEGLRAQQLTSPRARFGAAERYRSPEGVTIGGAFSFMASLSFRGKTPSPRHFAAPPPELALGSPDD